MGRTTRRREKPQPNETGGFRFAVTLLAAFGTMLYAAYTYLQTTPVDPFWYMLVCRLILVVLIFVLGLLLYILIKGYSMEMQDSDQRKSWAIGASYIYLIVFSIFVMLLVYIFDFFLWEYVIKTEKVAIEILFLMFAPITAGTVFFLLSLRKKPKKVIMNIFLTMECAFVVFLFLLLHLFPTLLYSPLQGHVTMDMESVYYKNDAPIPVLIHVTGPNTNLSVFLFKEESNNSLNWSDSIELIPELFSNKTESGKYLVGNTLDYGTYNVFINTTDLTAGYYELHCVRLAYWKTYGARGFYLLNSSEQSYIKE